MNILISATYFHPYRSGLSTYALRLAEGLVAQGHKVVVLTSQHEKELNLQEAFKGIVVIRVPVGLRLSKGVLMPSLKRVARQWITWADVVNLHLPQFESAALALIAKRMRKPVVVTYHCDLEMKGGLFSRLAGWGTNLLAKSSLRSAKLIVQNSRDYAEYSRTLQPFLHKIVEVPTPIQTTQASAADVSEFQKTYVFKPDQQIIGLAGRVAAEKGWEYLAQAMPLVWQRFPNAVVAHSGMWQGVIGEEKYQARIETMLKPFGERWRILGYLDEVAFNAFFAACDVFVLASLNRTESFGIVQVEALSQGTPVIASDLPGIRVPVTRTGCGSLVKPRDIQGLAQAIIKLLSSPNNKCDAKGYLESFSIENVAAQYLEIFQKAGAR